MPAQPRTRLCYVCGATFPDVAARLAHLGADHAGYRIEWAGRDPVVVDPDGGRRLVTKAEQARFRRKVKANPASPPKAPRVRRTIEQLAADADRAMAADTPDDEPASAAPTGRPFVSQPSVRITPEYRRSTMRDDVTEAFTLDMLATILRDLSIAISEADGAGEDGYLTRIQAVQLANLVYDVTVDTIVSRFAGNVGRFKMALAAVLILVSKGRVHARAIGAKLGRRNAERTAAAVIADTTPDADFSIPVDPRTADAADLDELDRTDPIAALRIRQAQAAGRSN